jgi:hypothetical protein
MRPAKSITPFTKVALGSVLGALNRAAARRNRAWSVDRVQSLEDRTIPSSLAGLGALPGAAAQMAEVRSDAKAKQPPPFRIRRYQVMAEFLFRSYSGDIPAVLKSAAINQFEQALATAKVPVVGVSQLGIQRKGGIFPFDNGGGTLYEIELVLHPHAHNPLVYRAQTLVTDSDGIVANISQGDPNQLVNIPPSTPVDANRLGTDLELLLNKYNLTFGPVQPLMIGADFQNELALIGAPTSAFDVHFSFGPIQASTQSFSAIGSAFYNFNTNSSDLYWFQMVLNSDGTFVVNTDVAIPPMGLLPIPGGQYAPFPASVFIETVT